MRLSTKFATLLALPLVALAFAACGDSDDDDGGDSEAAAADTGALQVASVDGTDVLADADGRTLYTADVEQGGEILCTGACESFWEPALGSDADAQAAADELGADVGVVMRPGGDEQLALDGAPLYSFTEEGPGELTGDGFTDDFQGTTFTWEAAVAEGAEPASDEDAGGGIGGGY
jgi:predicted lipoprotein with Yx(FWY)xxD motif